MTRILFTLLSIPLLSICLGVLLVNKSHADQAQNRIPEPSQARFEQGKYKNTSPKAVQDMSKLGTILWRYISEKRQDPTPVEPIPLLELHHSALKQQEHTSLYRLGHSSVLFNFSGEIWLADPVFSERASPVQWAGPKRFHPAPVALEQLSDITGVVISHNHYDHLDKATIQSLHPKVSHFLVPLGVGEKLMDWGVPADKIQELTWWQDITVGKLQITATPAQHFSGRSLFDSDETLWASWVFQSQDAKIFFSGDSGYFDGFKQIGEKFGPFDVTLMETGAYDKDWPDVHMHPAQSLQAHMDLKGKVLIPIHNSTFDLAMHPWYEPLEALTKLAESQEQNVVTPIIGQAFDIGADNKIADNNHYHYWWRDMMPEQAEVKSEIARKQEQTEASLTSSIQNAVGE